MAGELFIVATPIGNLDDITLRAIETLKRVDLIAAEDTRHTRQLLNHLGIDGKLLSLHEHNEHARIAHVVDLLGQGQAVALVSDAGTPLISDPGYPLVRAVTEAGFRVIPVPGASSVITALCAAGLPTDHFCFHGFLSHKDGEREKQLQAIFRQPGAHVLFESTHRILRLLGQLDVALGDSEIVIAKELTKRHERFLRGSAAQCLAQLNKEPGLQKGEFVVLFHRPPMDDEQESATGVERLLDILLAELPLKQAVSLAVEISGVKRNKVYRKALAMSRPLDG